MLFAGEKDFDSIKSVFYKHKKWFPHVRTDYMKRMIAKKQMIFEDGKSDASAGRPQKTAKNPIDVSTLRGVVNSWIPPQHASRIYKVGYEIDKATEADMNRLSSAISESCDVLFNRTDFEIQNGFTEKLLGRPSSDINLEENMNEEPITES